MDRRLFKQLLGGQVAPQSALSREQLLQLSGIVLPPLQSDQCAQMIETARRPHLRCPCCEATRLYRDGHANGLQRFRCRDCGRTFNSLTGTPLARLRLKEKWLAYLDTLRDPATTVRRAAEQVEVHRTTAFRWRHRMLTKVKQDQQMPLRGIVEVGEMVVQESHKGCRQLGRAPRIRGGKVGARGNANGQIRVLIARDREGRTHDAVIGKGPLTTTHLNTHLAPALDNDVLLITDSLPVYRAFTRQHRISHHIVHPAAGRRPRRTMHIQNVSGYHSRLRTWLDHFRGVATRYLDNYCGWRRAIDAPRINSAEEFLRAAVGVFRS